MESIYAIQELVDEHKEEMQMPIRMSPMFDGHDPRWKRGKQLMKRLYDIHNNQAMSDDEFMACQDFVDEVFRMSLWRRDNFEGHVEFLTMMRKSYTGCSELSLNVPWRILKAKYDRDNADLSSCEFDRNECASAPRTIPMFKEMDDKCYIAFVQEDMLKVGKELTEWVEFTQEFVRSIAHCARKE